MRHLQLFVLQQQQPAQLLQLLHRLLLEHLRHLMQQRLQQLLGLLQPWLQRHWLPYFLQRQQPKHRPLLFAQRLQPRHWLF